MSYVAGKSIYLKGYKRNEFAEKMLNYIFQSTKIKKGVVSTSEKFIVCVG